MSSCSDKTKVVTGLISNFWYRDCISVISVIREIQGYIMSSEKFSYEDGYKADLRKSDKIPIIQTLYSPEE